MACVLHVTQTWRPDEIVVLGDWLDGAAFSSHGRRSFADRAPEFVSAEVGPCNDFLDKLQGRNSRPLVYIEGNHEARVERFAANLGEVGHDLHKLMSPRTLIEHRVDSHGKPHRKRKRFTWIPYLGQGIQSHYLISPEKRRSTALIAVHGWSTAKHAAAVHLAKARDVSVVHGHTHRAQAVWTRHSLTDKRLGAWSPGCLCELRPNYTATSPNDWSHGFSMIYVGRDSWMEYTIPIFSDGSCVLPNGRRVVG